MKLTIHLQWLKQPMVAWLSLNTSLQRYFLPTITSYLHFLHVWSNIFSFQKLQKANDDLKETTSLRQGEIDTLKSTCDRLSAGTLKKEKELQDYTDRIQQLEMQV